MKRFRLITINTIFLLFFTHLPLLGQSIYFNDFENPGLLTEWSLLGSAPSGDWGLAEPILSPTPGTAQHFPDRFLGQFAGDDSTSLTLNDVPSDSTITLSFDLYIIRSWDGIGWPQYGPNVWDLSVDGTSLLHTTFNNFTGGSQSYPGNYYPDAPTNPSLTGAYEVDTLGYYCSYVDGIQDSVYHFYDDRAFTFYHSDGPLVITFSGIGLQYYRMNEGQDPQENVWDESWGLDNVQVTPEPATICLLGFGGLALMKKRRM